MTLEQKKILNELYKNHEKGVATYGGFEKCDFLIYENKILDSDKNIILFREVVYDYNHEGIPKIRMIKNIITPEGDILNLNDNMTNKEQNEYLNSLSKIDIESI